MRGTQTFTNNLEYEGLFWSNIISVLYLAYILTYAYILFLEYKYWDTRQAQPSHIQQLPERCYALAVDYPLMVVGTADRQLIVYNPQNPQVRLFYLLSLINTIWATCIVKKGWCKMCRSLALIGIGSCDQWHCAY
jgi:hypothetical protein